MHQKPIFFNRALRCEAGVSNITFFIFFMNDLFENKSVNDTAVVTVNQINQFSPAKSHSTPVLCLGQDFFWTQVFRQLNFRLYLNFRGTLTNSGGRTKS